MKIAQSTIVSILFFSCLLFAQDSIKFSLSQSIPNHGGNDIILADFNNDFDIDIFVANGVYNNPLPSKLLKNNGDGFFAFSEQSIGSSQTNSFAVGDINMDGSLDLFLANANWNEGDYSKLYINNSNGIFIDSRNHFGKSNASCAALGDLNNDGWLDVYIANHPYSDETGGEDEIWLNDGKGDFIKSDQEFESAYAARRVKLADIDSDKDLDAIVLNGNSYNEIWLNNGQGEFYLSESKIGKGENIDFAVGDINNDNAIDIVIAKGAWGKSPKGIEIWINDGKGNFLESQNIGEYDCYGVALCDLNDDNYLDVITVNGKDQPNQILFNDKNGNFVESLINIGQGGMKLVCGDINKDSLQDIVIVDEEMIKIYFQTRK